MPSGPLLHNETSNQPHEPSPRLRHRRMILKASIVVPIEGPPIPDGAVMIDDDCIVAVGPASELTGRNGRDVHDLKGMALMPGLINAHCHLDYSTLRYAISPQRSFTAWVRRINA